MQTLFGEEPDTRIYTVGYQGKLPEQVRDLMQCHCASVLVDTRRSPHSRNAKWNKKALQAFFGDAYLSLTALGNHGETAAWQPKDWNETNEALEKVAEWVRNGESVLLLCMEANPKDCHRTDVAQHLEARTGCKVRHLR